MNRNFYGVVVSTVIFVFFGVLFGPWIPVFASEVQGEGEWPAWRGGRFGGDSEVRGLFEGAVGLEVVWRKPVGSGYSAVAISQGTVVTLASDHDRDFIVALDEKTGKERWRCPIAKTFPGRDGAVDGPVSTPAIDEEMVFALGPFGHLFAVDLRTGKRRWSTHLPEEHSAATPHWGFTTSPLVYEDLLIVATGGTEQNMVTAFDKKTGRVVWAAGDDEVNYQSPIVLTLDGKDQIVCAGEGRLYGLDPDDGQSIWERRHGGQGFYAKIINPVVVKERELFMTYRSFESQLLSIEEGEDGYEAARVWKSRDLRSNYNIAAYHRGHLYGYSGDFLVCVDATSGKLEWKSRPPGNGFLIGVDGHLVILTKKGLLSVVKATPEKYQEVAKMQIFERRSWTPPSFANDHLFVRCEVDDVAKVRVVKEKSRVLAEARPSLETIEVPGSEFEKFVSSLETAKNKNAQLDRFFREQESFPLYENERVVHVVYRGEAEDVAIRGDMFEIGTQVSMRRVEGTDLFFASFEFDSRAILNYQLIKDFGNPGPDPRNPLQLAGLGGVSLIRMPKHQESPMLLEEGNLERGRIEEVPFRIAAKRVGGLVWQGSRTLKVYLPPGYEKGEDRYSVFYVHDGNSALRDGKMKEILDRGIGKAFRPIMVVFIPLASAYEYARSQRDVYAEALVKEIVPLIDGRYRTVSEESGRAILGGGEGGFGALFASLKYPGVFGAVAAQSIMPIGEGGDLLLDLIGEGTKGKTRYYLDWGKYDQRMTASGADVARSGSLLTKRLRQTGSRVSGGETPNGAGFASWRSQTHKILADFFPR